MNENAAEKALKYLAETDEEHANAKALVKALENSLKTVRGIAFLEATGTVGEKEAKAYASQSYIDYNKRYQDAWADFQLLDNKRLRAQLAIEVWRSTNANMRKGNV